MRLSSERRLEALGRLARHVHADDRVPFAAAFVVVPAVAGEALVRDGEGNDALWVVVDGLFVVEIELDGGPIALGEIGPGGWFGELSLLTGAAATATVRARGAATALRMDQEALSALHARRPHAEIALVRALSEDLADRVRDGTAALGPRDEEREGRRGRLRSVLARLLGRRS